MVLASTRLRTPDRLRTKSKRTVIQHTALHHLQIILAAVLNYALICISLHF
jgi:hypothetical protein